MVLLRLARPATKTGVPFFINQAGDVIATLNNVAATSYTGTQTIPTNDAAFSVASDMGAADRSRRRGPPW